MDRIFHHILWNVAQIQLVLGLRWLEAQLWQGTKAAVNAAVFQAAPYKVINSGAIWTAQQCRIVRLALTFMFGNPCISV